MSPTWLFREEMRERVGTYRLRFLVRESGVLRIGHITKIADQIHHLMIAEHYVH
jgi:hypothetical protein